MKTTDMSASVRAKAKHILAPLDGMELPTPAGYYVLIAQWAKPEKVGSIIIAHQTRDEDKYQGRAGVVLAVGADAYKGERYPGGAWCKAGDFVAWPAMENAANRMTYGGVVLTVIPDDRITLVGIDPAMLS